MNNKIKNGLTTVALATIVGGSTSGILHMVTTIANAENVIPGDLGNRITWGTQDFSKFIYMQTLDGKPAYRLQLSKDAITNAEFTAKVDNFTENVKFKRFARAGYPHDSEGLVTAALNKDEAQRVSTMVLLRLAVDEGFTGALPVGMTKDVFIAKWDAGLAEEKTKNPAAEAYARTLLTKINTGDLKNHDIDVVEPTNTLATYNPTTKRLESPVFYQINDVESSNVTVSGLTDGVFLINEAGAQITTLQKGQKFKFATTNLDLTKNLTNIQFSSNISDPNVFIFESGNLSDLLQAKVVAKLPATTTHAEFSSVLGDVEITKIDSRTKKPIAGVTFQLLDTGRNVRGTAVSDAAGKVRFNNHIYGSYILHEVPRAADGYVDTNVSDDISFEIGKGTLTHVKGDGTIENTPTEANFEIKDSQGAYLAGVTIELLDTTGKVIKSWQSKVAPEQLHNLPAGEYILKETAAPSRFQYAKETRFTVKEDGTISRTTLVNAPTKLKITKTDKISKAPVAGAEYQAFSEDGKTALQMFDAKGALVAAKAVTNAQGVAEFTGLPAGKILIRETKAPAGYQLQGDEIITLGQVTDHLQSIIEDRTRLIVTKTDEKTGQPVAGSTFIVKSKDGKDIQKMMNAKGEMVDAVAVSDAKGVVLFEGLPVGEYLLVETDVPSGFKKMPDQYVTITAKGNVLRDVKGDRTRLIITKRDGATGKPLAGAKFGLFGQDGKITKMLDAKGTSIDAYAVSNANGEAIFEGVAKGQYILKEVETPKGYMTNSDMEVTITDTVTTLREFINMPKPQVVVEETKILPKTGVYSQGSDLVVVFGAGFLATIAGVDIKRRVKR